jgi:hypothetical protein
MVAYQCRVLHGEVPTKMSAKSGSSTRFTATQITGFKPTGKTYDLADPVAPVWS